MLRDRNVYTLVCLFTSKNLFYLHAGLFIRENIFICRYLHYGCVNVCFVVRCVVPPLTSCILYNRHIIHVHKLNTFVNAQPKFFQ